MNSSLTYLRLSPKCTLCILFGLFFILSFTACNDEKQTARRISFPIKNNSSITKTVERASAKKQMVLPKKKKKIYLTFDDGPNKGTPAVLNIMEQEQIPVSFFLVASHVEGSAEQALLFERLKTSGITELCNHSYSHAGNRYEKFYSQPDSVVRDFEKAQLVMQLPNNIARCPGRNAWRIDSLQITDIRKSKSAIDSLQKKGFTVVGWDLEWHFDAKTMKPVQTPEKMIAEIDSALFKNKTRHADNVILLAHDQAYRSTDDSVALHQFVRLLKEKDYELDVVSNYPLFKKQEMVPDSSVIK